MRKISAGIGKTTLAVIAAFWVLSLVGCGVAWTEDSAKSSTAESTEQDSAAAENTAYPDEAVFLEILPGAAADGSEEITYAEQPERVTAALDEVLPKVTVLAKNPDLWAAAGEGVTYQPDGGKDLILYRTAEDGTAQETSGKDLLDEEYQYEGIDFLCLWTEYLPVDRAIRVHYCGKAEYYVYKDYPLSEHYDRLEWYDYTS